MKQQELTKEQKAARESSPQQPLEMDRAASLTTRCEVKSEAAVFQQKMKLAARILTREWLVRSTEAYKDFDSFVFCTPENVFCRLDGQWIRITKDYLEDAAGEATGNLKKYTPSSVANFVLSTIRQFCRDLKRVSWTLPKLEGGVA